MKEYNHKKIEKKWQTEWEKKKVYQASDKSKKEKFYGLMEFPYPSGDGLHVGHVRGYTAMDILSRKKRMEGKNVLFPIGWDAFGLPTENYAIKTGKQPSVITKKNTDNFRKQFKSLGMSFDWPREINTTDPAYYKWTQWLFLQFLKKGLAYKTKSEINWCPKDKIGLANEEVVNGKCERCGAPTIKKEKEQWMLAITKYAERLDKDLDLVDYPERVKLSQRNWIGKSEGSEIEFGIKNNNKIKKVVILHGRNGSSKNYFYPWLKEEIERTGAEVYLPDLPNTNEPDDEEQADFVIKNIPLDEETVFITHSFGGIVAMRILERGIKIGGLIQFSTPTSGEFLDDKKRESVTSATKKGFSFGKIKKNADYFRVIFDSGDNIVPKEDGEYLAKNLGVNLEYIKAKETHFCAKEEPEMILALFPKIKIFTTRADTLFGVTYVVLAPEHPLVNILLKQATNRGEVETYINQIKNKSDLDRAEAKEKTGIELKEVKAINPANNEEVPIWIADYVLPHYGTGAVMAVPAHDERDFEFAQKFGLKIKQVIEPLFIKNLNKDVPLVERNAISAILKHWSEDKYLCLKWKKVDWVTFVTGGIEKGQTPEEAARAEILEETGYFNLRLIKNLSKIHSKFFHVPKNENRFGHFHGFYFQLENGGQKEITEEEKSKHEVIWLKPDEIDKFLVTDGEKLNFKILNNEQYVHTEYGILNNSGQFNGMESNEAIRKITEFVGGKIVTKFKLRDWVFSRQRYWGEPIPVVNCKKCGLVPVKEKDLPVKLPEVKSYKPTDNGESPLAGIAKWVNIKCPKCKGPAKRETDTMPNWAGSSWYYLRYTDPKNKNKFADLKKMKYWTPVDWYNGGMEHTTLHLLYSRFWHKFFYDLKLVPTVEPYKKRTSHGMILGEGGVKMSKSLGNVVNPDEIVKIYGADTLRVYEMFVGPFEDTAVWNTESIIGSRRFIEKVWRIGEKVINTKKSSLSGSLSPRVRGALTLGSSACETPLQENFLALRKLLHKTIKKVGEDIEAMRFNTAISAMMILVTEMEKVEFIEISDYKKLLQILAPFAPHIAEDIWYSLGEKKSINISTWPKWDGNLIKDNELKIIIQVNGKVRAEMMVRADESEEKIKDFAAKHQNVLKFTKNQEIKKIIYVKNKLVNIVV